MCGTITECDPLDSIITDSTHEEIVSGESGTASTEELKESTGSDPVRNKKRELTAARIQRNTQSRVSFGLKGPRIVPRKTGRRMR